MSCASCASAFSIGLVSPPCRGQLSKTKKKGGRGGAGAGGGTAGRDGTTGGRREAGGGRGEGSGPGGG